MDHNTGNEDRDVHAELGNGYTRTQIARCISSKRLELTLLPTEKCNFRCTYCYETFELGRMPPRVVAGIKNLIARRAPTLHDLQISWFGGEPLLALPVIKDIASHAKKLSEAHGFRFLAGVTTNAYLLTPRVLQELVDLNQTFYQVSIDGTESEHNKTRLRADGAGTFGVIWNNLLAARNIDREFVIQLRVHLKPENFDSLKDLMLMLREHFRDDPRFQLDIQHIRNMGGPGAANVKLLTEAEIKRRAHYLRILASTGSPPIDTENAAPQSIESGSPRRATERGAGLSGSADICYASKPNHWLIRANGQVGRCTVILDNPKNNLGQIEEDGTLRLNTERVTPWFAGFADLDPDVLACPVAAVPNIKNQAVRIPIKAA
jgi:uncharacterized protein